VVSCSINALVNTNTNYVTEDIGALTVVNQSSYSCINCFAKGTRSVRSVPSYGTKKEYDTLLASGETKVNIPLYSVCTICKTVYKKYEN